MAETATSNNFATYKPFHDKDGDTAARGGKFKMSGTGHVTIFTLLYFYFTIFLHNYLIALLKGHMTIHVAMFMIHYLLISDSLHYYQI